MRTSLKKIASKSPWWGKIAIKLLLSRLPVHYQVWKRLHLFENGAMEEPSYAHCVYRKHFDAARSRKNFKGFVGMELGPGDSRLSAMIAHAYGATAYHLIDVGAFAQSDVKGYEAMAALLASQGLATIKVEKMTSVEAILAACGATYGTHGLISLQTIPNHSVDYIWSHTVLQHIRRSEFLDTMKELIRVLRPDGISSHWVDLQDCLGGALNNLRFSEAVWESSVMAESGFYTNRIRCSEMLARFRDAGFVPEVIAVVHWDCLPTRREKLWGPFKALSETDLRVRGFHVLLRPA